MKQHRIQRKADGHVLQMRVCKAAHLHHHVQVLVKRQFMAISLIAEDLHLGLSYYRLQLERCQQFGEIVLLEHFVKLGQRNNRGDFGILLKVFLLHLELGVLVLNEQMVKDASVLGKKDFDHPLVPLLLQVEVQGLELNESVLFLLFELLLPTPELEHIILGGDIPLVQRANALFDAPFLQLFPQSLLAHLLLLPFFLLLLLLLLLPFEVLPSVAFL